MKAVVGLGNPGARYTHTRHNVGYWVVEHLADGALWHQASSYNWAKPSGDLSLMLIKPTTYMNSSGIAVLDLSQKFDIVPEDILVIVDDIHLDVGRLRFRRQGSHGGHNGLRSIEKELNSDAYPRLRIGVGQPPEPDDLIGHVLGTFSPDEFENIDVAHAGDGVLCWATLGIEKAMNQFN